MKADFLYWRCIRDKKKKSKRASQWDYFLCSKSRQAFKENNFKTYSAYINHTNSTINFLPFTWVTRGWRGMEIKYLYLCCNLVQYQMCWNQCRILMCTSIYKAHHYRSSGRTCMPYFYFTPMIACIFWLFSRELKKFRHYHGKASFVIQK